MVHRASGQVRKISPPPGFDPRTVQPVGSRYTDYATRPTVTICTASLTVNNSTFCPHSVFMCFVRISEQTAIISLYSIHGLVIVIGTGSLYCGVLAQYYNEMHVFSLSRDHVKSVVNKVSLVWIYFGCLSSTAVHPRSTHLHRHVATTERTGRRSLGTSRKHRLFLKPKRSTRYAVLSLLFYSSDGQVSL
jgi:hypothetical protein